MKYNILHDYGSEGFVFYKQDNETVPKDFETVGEAIAFAMELGYSTKFIIVNVIDFAKLIQKITK